MTPRILILADDITGALDSAVGFAGASRNVVVARSPEAMPEALAAHPDVLAINTSSREIAPEEAVRRVKAALAHLDRHAFSVVLKKVDSRLKGNVAAETEALARWFVPDRCVVCPAIPAMGRRVSAGALIGVGVAEPIVVAARFTGPVDVPDAATDADLDALVVGAERDTLWIGARGLAFALARASGVAAPEAAGLRPPVMVANGSRDPVTLSQIAALRAAFTVIEAPDGVAPEADLPDGPIVLSISDGGSGISGQKAAARFARSTMRLAERFKPAALLICGGESAQAVLDQFGVNSLQVVAELRPGLPMCEVETAWGPVQVVTKSGGFGAPDLLSEILEETRLHLQRTDR